MIVSGYCGVYERRRNTPRPARVSPAYEETHRSPPRNRSLSPSIYLFICLSDARVSLGIERAVTDAADEEIAGPAARPIKELGWSERFESGRKPRRAHKRHDNNARAPLPTRQLSSRITGLYSRRRARISVHYFHAFRPHSKNQVQL